MDKKTKIEFLQFLESVLTDERKKRFDDVLRRRTNYVVPVLEDVYQPHNISAVLRTCDGLGVQDVHVISNSFSANSGIEMGSSRWLNVRTWESNSSGIGGCIKSLKESGYKILVTVPREGAKPIGDIDVGNGRLALLLGNEVSGLSDEIIRHADAFVKIPMFGFTESFNISVSAGICLYDLLTRVRSSDMAWELTEDEILNAKLSWLENSLETFKPLKKKFLS